MTQRTPEEKTRTVYRPGDPNAPVHPVRRRFPRLWLAFVVTFVVIFVLGVIVVAAISLREAPAKPSMQAEPSTSPVSAPIVLGITNASDACSDGFPADSFAVAAYLAPDLSASVLAVILSKTLSNFVNQGPTPEGWYGFTYGDQIYWTLDSRVGE